MAGVLNIVKAKLIADCKKLPLAYESEIPRWDLTPYQGNGIGSPSGYWGLWSPNSNRMDYIGGKIDTNGKLLGLPDFWQGTVPELKLHQYCYDEASGISIYGNLKSTADFTAHTSN